MQVWVRETTNRNLVALADEVDWRTTTSRIIGQKVSCFDSKEVDNATIVGGLSICERKYYGTARVTISHSVERDPETKKALYCSSTTVMLL